MIILVFSEGFLGWDGKDYVGFYKMILLRGGLFEWEEIDFLVDRVVMILFYLFGAEDDFVGVIVFGFGVLGFFGIIVFFGWLVYFWYDGDWISLLGNFV